MAIWIVAGFVAVLAAAWWGGVRHHFPGPPGIGNWGGDKQILKVDNPDG
jgi:hypothetical protein